MSYTWWAVTHVSKCDVYRFLHFLNQMKAKLCSSFLFSFDACEYYRNIFLSSYNLATSGNDLNEWCEAGGLAIRCSNNNNIIRHFIPDILGVLIELRNHWFNRFNVDNAQSNLYEWRAVCLLRQLIFEFSEYYDVLDIVNNDRCDSTNKTCGYIVFVNGAYVAIHTASICRCRRLFFLFH